MQDWESSSHYDRRIFIERQVADNSLDGAGSGTPELVKAVWANLLDLVQHRGNQISDGIETSTRRARLRIRYRPGITPDLQFVIGTRRMRVVTGPIELGRRVALEFIVEDHRPAGSAA